MAKKQPKPAAADAAAPRGNPVGLHPLTPEQAIRGMFQMSKEGAARIVASRPEKKADGKARGRKK